MHCIAVVSGISLLFLFPCSLSRVKQNAYSGGLWVVEYKLMESMPELMTMMLCREQIRILFCCFFLLLHFKSKWLRLPPMLSQ